MSDGFIGNGEELALKREDWDKRYEEQALVWSIEPNQFVKAELDTMTPGKALDLGSGEGRNALWLAQQGWQVTAVDFSAVALDKARRLAKIQGLSVTWLLEDVLRCEPESESYDLVLLSYLQLPMQERQKVLTTGRDALVPGGTLLFVAHDLSNLGRGIGGPRSAEVLCTPQEVVADLPGFDILKAEVVTRDVEEDGEVVGVAFDTLVRAQKRS